MMLVSQALHSVLERAALVVNAKKAMIANLQVRTTAGAGADHFVACTLVSGALCAYPHHFFNLHRH